MAVNFPDSPSNGDTFTSGALTFTWNGSAWKLDPSSGTKGDKGQKGEVGVTGDKGQKGQKGEVGDKGQKGEIGATGGTGSTGDKGQKGEVGATGGGGSAGVKGQKGEKGQIGADGGSGADGSDGSKGQKGEQGSTAGTASQVLITGSNTNTTYRPVFASTYGSSPGSASQLFADGNLAYNASTNVFTASTLSASTIQVGDISRGVTNGDIGVLQEGTGKFNIFRPETKAKNIIPLDDSQYDLGTSTVKWQDVYADNLHGDGSNITNVGGGVPSGGIIIWSGAANAIPSGWYLCDGNNSTPNLSGKFVVGYSASDSDFDVGDTGGSKNATLVSHSHTVNSHTHGDGSLTAANRSLTGSITGISESFAGFGGSASGVFSKVGGYNLGGTPGAPDNNNTGGVNFNGSHTHDVTGSTGSASPGTNSQGSSSTNANLPPYYALCYIMKA